jgi:hypothetical protein
MMSAKSTAATVHTRFCCAVWSNVGPMRSSNTEFDGVYDIDNAAASCLVALNTIYRLQHMWRFDFSENKIH